MSTMKTSLSELRGLIHETVKTVLLEKYKTVEDDVGGRPRLLPNTLFAQWVDSHEGGSETVASMLNVEVAHINKLARNSALPSMKLAAKIADKSSGKIPVNYWAKQASKKKSRK